MSDNNESLKEGTLLSHLLELRDRMLRMCIALLIVFIPAAYFGNDILVFLSEPLKEALPPGSKLVSTDVMGVFTTPFMLSFYVSLAIVMPYLLFEIWGFVAPGLYKHEKRFAGPLVFSSIALFLRRHGLRLLPGVSLACSSSWCRSRPRAWR